MATRNGQKETKAMGWNDYSKDAEATSGGDWPEIPDDLYDMRVSDVSEPEEQADIFNPGKTRTQFFVTWEILSSELPEDTTLRQYISLPEKYLSDGFLAEKANCFKVMEALGFDMTGRFRVDPTGNNEWRWIDKRARGMIENKPNKDGDMRPRITGVKPKRTATPKREPVAAGPKGSLRARLEDGE